jgi:glycosyltransferase involved in cell wall biosynthesis
MGTNISAKHPEGLPGYVMVLSWFPESAIGGVNQAVLNLIHTMQLEGRYRPLLLVSNGHALPERAPHIECEVISLQLRSPDIPADRTVISLLAFLYHLPGTLLALRALVRRHNVQAFNCVFPDNECLNIVLLKKLRLFSGKLCLWFQGNDIKTAMEKRGFGAAAFRWMLRRSDVVAACSRGLLEDVLRFEPRCSHNSVVIHNAIDIEKFRAKAATDYELPETLQNAPFLLNVAGFERKKGQDVLIRAFERIAGEFPDLVLVMIGSSSGEATTAVRAMVQESPLRNRILMLENIPHERIPLFLQAARVFVLASRREGLPFAILEAAACLTPVVATACIGVPEIVQDGITGRLVPVDDDAALANAIRDMLTDEVKRKQFAANMYRLVNEKFTWRATYEKWVGL